MRRIPLVPALLAATLVLAGCGGSGDDPEADPSGTPTESTSSEPTDPTEPTEPTEPAVEPATGFLIDLDRVRMNAPEGWKKHPQLATFLIQADDPRSYSHVSLGDLSAVGDASLQQQARDAIDTRPGAKIYEPVEIAGVAWYHVGGRNDRYTTFQNFGTISHDSQATISFLLDNDIPDDEQQELIDAVLASVEWK